ncbi:MAG: MBL fold metallo-hydrolase [Gammaproteobacteria bacterium]|nr:MBL fold metallo-hydrolase [Gammaproteobacteria bacterium]
MIGQSISLPAALLALLLTVDTGFAESTLRDYPVDRITANTYVIHGPLGYPSVENQGFMNNPGFVVTDSGVVLIDPGSSVQAGRMVLKQLGTITDKPITHVISSHVHGDHWLGNQAIAEAFPEAVFMAHPEMIKRAHAGAADEWINLMAQATEGFTAGTRAVIPAVSTSEIGRLETGGMTFRFHAPERAHSGTDVMIEVVEESVLFLGDNVTYKRIARMDDASFNGSIAACDTAIDLAVLHYIPGHGPTGDVGIVNEFRKYLATLYGEAERLYEEGLADFEMKPEIVQKLAPYADWVNFDDQVGRHISLAILEIEKNNF